MKKLLFFVFFTLQGIALFSQTPAPATIADRPANDTLVYAVSELDSLPSFPGGEDALRIFLGQHLNYPQEARVNAVSGTVVVGFIIEKDGTLTHLNLRKKKGFGLDEEALRVVGLMPKWNPGLKNGISVRTEFWAPVRFSLM